VTSALGQVFFSRTPISACLLAAVACVGLMSASVSAHAVRAPQMLGESQSTIGLDELQPGMKGIGYTVVRGTTPEQFTVEVIGVLENILPKQDLIVGRLSGLGLEDTGVTAGMSGSPVYFDGRLAGAVAYRLGQFSKEPIAGITPIESMGRMLDAQNRQASTVAATVFRTELLSAAAELLSGRSPDNLATLYPISGGSGITPIATPVTIGGAHSMVVSRLSPLFEALGWRPALGGRSSSAQVNQPLQAGGAVAAELMRGDITFAASGTVTHVDGDTVLAFGHPFMQGGNVDYPMVGAEVLLFLSSLSSSERLTASGSEVLGAVRQDTQSGILGVIGAQPSTIPVRLVVSDPGGEIERFSFEIIADKSLSPTFLFMGMANGLQSVRGNYGDNTFEVQGEIFLQKEGLDSIKIRNVFSSPNQAYIPLSLMVMQIYAYLYDNPFESVGVSSIDLQIRALNQLKTAEIARVWTDRSEVRAGDTINVAVGLKPYRQPEIVKHFPVTIPADTPPGRLSLLVADATAMAIEEQSLLQGGRRPRDLHQLVDLINDMRASDNIYLQLSRPAEGAMFGGQPMPALPASVLEVLMAGQTSGEAVRLRRTVILEEENSVDLLVTGEHRLELRVRRP
jgi:hypothetical protein